MTILDILLIQEIEKYMPDTEVVDNNGILTLKNKNFDDVITIDTETYELSSEPADEKSFFVSIIEMNLEEIIEKYHRLKIEIFPFFAERHNFRVTKLDFNKYKLNYGKTGSLIADINPEKHPYLKFSNFRFDSYDEFKSMDKDISGLFLEFYNNKKYQLSKEPQNKILDKIVELEDKELIEEAITDILDIDKSLSKYIDTVDKFTLCDVYHSLLINKNISYGTAMKLFDRLGSEYSSIQTTLKAYLMGHVENAILSDFVYDKLLSTIENVAKHIEQEGVHLKPIMELLSSDEDGYSKLREIRECIFITPYEKSVLGRIIDFQLPVNQCHNILIKIKNRIFKGLSVREDS